MITFLHTNLFHSPAQTLVNTVNIVGVMGKGIAKQFKTRHPDMFKEYKQLCDRKGLSTGNLHLWRGEQNWVLNFPTKTTWRQPSRMEYVEAGLDKFVSTYKELGITSASFPPLGCGNGNLIWQEVRPLMERYLKKVNIPIFIHNVQVRDTFVAEHTAVNLPANFNDFYNDIEHALSSEEPSLQTGAGNSYLARIDSEDIIIRFESGKSEKIRSEMIENAYSRLREGLLTRESVSTDRERKLLSYFFPIIDRIPYITKASSTKSGPSHSEAQVFFIDRIHRGEPVNISPEIGSQGCLFQ